MEKELFSELGYSDLKGPSVSTADLEKIREEEKKMKQEAGWLTGIGFVALIAGVAAFVLANFALPIAITDFLGLAVGAGVIGLGYGAFRVIKRIFRKKTLNLPTLKLKRKGMSGSVERSSEKAFTETTSYIPNKLGKSFTNKVFSGVAGGLAEYAGISPTLMRLIFIFAFFFTSGTAAIAYVLMAIFMPTNKPEKKEKLRSYN